MNNFLCLRVRDCGSMSAVLMRTCTNSARLLIKGEVGSGADSSALAWVGT